MNSEFANKTFLITGSASGMGLATATLLANRGACLAICDINQPGIEKIGRDLASQYQDRPILARAVDVTDRKSVEGFLDEVKEQLGGVHGIANFAGTGGHQLGVEPVWQTTDSEFDFIINLNIRRLFNLLGEALKPKFSSELRSIVHITSMFGERGYENGAVFAASKHAAIGMVKSTALEIGRHGIRINSILPGAVETPMYHQVRSNAGMSLSASNTPIPRPGQPQEVARVAAFLLSEESSYVTGATWNIDGGANA